MGRERSDADARRGRAAAPDAQEAGEAPDVRAATSRSSRPRSGRPGDDSLDEGTAAPRRGRPHEPAGDPSERGRRGPPPPGPGPAYQHQERCGYTEQHEQVLLALTAAQECRHGEGVYLEEVARASGLSPQEARSVLHDLTQVHRLVTELAGADRPDLGPRFAVTPRL